MIDLKDLANSFVARKNGAMHVALGGLFPSYNKKLKDFVANLIDSGAALVFFMPGNMHKNEATFNSARSNATYLQYVSALDKIEQITSISDLENAFANMYREFDCNFPMVKAYEYNLERMTRSKGEFYINNGRHRQRIARYAKEHANEVLAVITNDTDFLAFEGRFQFWHAKSINLNNLTGQRYSKRILYDKFGMNIHQMQLLGALCGSNYLSSEILSGFHNRLASENTDPKKNGKIWLVSAYVKKQVYTADDGEINFDLHKLSSDVFGCRYTPEQRRSIGKCLKSYHTNFTDDENVNESFLMGHNTFLFDLSESEIFHILDIEFVDFRNCKTKNYAELIIPVLMKMCGILFKDRVERPVVRKICVKQAHDEPFKVVEHEIIYPSSK